jgi:hypothetical protein
MKTKRHKIGLSACLLLVFLIVSGTSSEASQTPHQATLTLVSNDGNFNRVNVTFTPKWTGNPGPDTQTTVMSGTMELALNVDTSSGTSNLIFLTGAGTVSNTNVRLRRSGTLLRPIGYDISLNGMSGNMNSSGSVRQMNAGTGTFSGLDHRYSVTTGKAEGQVGGGIETVDESFTESRPLIIAQVSH